MHYVCMYAASLGAASPRRRRLPSAAATPPRGGGRRHLSGGAAPPPASAMSSGVPDVPADSDTTDAVVASARKRCRGAARTRKAASSGAPGLPDMPEESAVAPGHPQRQDALRPVRRAQWTQDALRPVHRAHPQRQDALRPVRRAHPRRPRRACIRLSTSIVADIRMARAPSRLHCRKYCETHGARWSSHWMCKVGCDI